MRAVARASAALAFAFVWSCAQQQPPPKKKAATPPPEPGKATETVAFDVERRINAAETELQALNPDAAVEHLDAVRMALRDDRFEKYPEARALRTRHKELMDRVPDV